MKWTGIFRCRKSTQIHLWITEGSAASKSKAHVIGMLLGLKLLFISEKVDRSMVQWDNILVDKYEFDKTKILDLFDTLSSGPAAAKEWCV